MGFFDFLFGSSRTSFEGRLTIKDSEEVRYAWGRVKEQLTYGKPSNFRQAVIEADKTLDFVLSRMYPNLNTTGERLKMAKVKFVDNWEVYDGLWYAHKIRNELVHNINFELPTSQVQDILEKFKVGLETLGAM